MGSREAEDETFLSRSVRRLRSLPRWLGSRKSDVDAPPRKVGSGSRGQGSEAAET